MRRHAKAMSAALGLSILIGALFASSALGASIHSFSSAFGSSGSGPGQFSANRAIAIDQTDGSLYVADSGNYRVQKFDAAGNFVLAFGKDVNQTTSGDVCTAASGNTCGAGTQGSGGSGFDTNNGFAKATTPLLDKPIEGPVYLRSSSHELPDLIVALSGQVDVVVAGRVDTGKGGGIRNTLEATPDAPISKFVLEMQGGKKGLLVNSENICKKPQKAIVSYTAHNGAAYSAQPLIKNDCPKKAKKRGGGKKGAKKGSGK